jgi:hypothetical protein
MRPKVGPNTAEERKQRSELETGMSGGQFSSALGWIVRLGTQLNENGQQEIEDILGEIQTSPRFHDEQRLCQGWAVLTYFTLKVCLITTLFV